MLSHYPSNGKRQEHSLPSRTKWTIGYIIHIKYATTKNNEIVTKQPGSIPSNFLVLLLKQQKSFYLVSTIVNKLTSKFIMHDKLAC